MVEVGDHMLILGRVVGVEGNPSGQDDSEALTGLCYLDGRYRSPGPLLSPRKLS